MALDPLTAALDLGGKLIERIWPDPATKDAAKLELLRMAQAGELAHLQADTDLAKGQVAVNQVEAASTRLFVAGWRPFIGWICGAALGFKYIGGPLLAMAAAAVGHPVTLPDLGTAELMPLLLGILGLGAQRTYEKVKGAA